MQDFSFHSLFYMGNFDLVNGTSVCELTISGVAVNSDATLQNSRITGSSTSIATGPGAVGLVIPAFGTLLAAEQTQKARADCRRVCEAGGTFQIAGSKCPRGFWEKQPPMCVSLPVTFARRLRPE